MLIHFVGFGAFDGFAEAISTRFAGETGVTWSTGAVEDMYPTAASRDGVAFVSPANCLLFMDGGIDRVYSEVMFPDVRDALKGCLTKDHPTLSTALGRPYLPIASALLVPTCCKASSYLVSAPTICMPQDVSGTRNAYHAFMAVLSVLRLAPPSVHTVVCPGLCTGWGNMPATVAAQQIHDAYVAFGAGQVPPGSYTERHDGHCFFGAPEPLDEQPDYYMNCEFKVINPCDVVHA